MLLTMAIVLFVIIFPFEKAKEEASARTNGSTEMCMLCASVGVRCDVSSEKNASNHARIEKYFSS
jgi:uncharacterized protein (UPF0333 family)